MPSPKTLRFGQGSALSPFEVRFKLMWKKKKSKTAFKIDEPQAPSWPQIHEYYDLLFDGSII